MCRELKESKYNERSWRNIHNSPEIHAWPLVVFIVSADTGKLLKPNTVLVLASTHIPFETLLMTGLHGNTC